MNLKDKIAKMEIELAELKAECSKQEVEYPLFMRNKENGKIVKFTSLSEGTVVWKGSVPYSEIEYYSESWFNHTDTDVWEEVAYDEDRDLWDGQPIWCWDDECTHSRDLSFYDAVNKCVYAYDGRRVGFVHDNYKAINSDHYESWMVEAYKTLEK